MPKTEPLKNRHHFPRFEDGWLRHPSVDLDGLNADEFRLDLPFVVLEQHLEHFPKVGIELVKRRALGMRSREPRNMANVQT